MSNRNHKLNQLAERSRRRGRCEQHFKIDKLLDRTTNEVQTASNSELYSMNDFEDLNREFGSTWTNENNDQTESQSTSKEELDDTELESQSLTDEQTERDINSRLNDKVDEIKPQNVINERIEADVTSRLSSDIDGIEPPIVNRQQRLNDIVLFDLKFKMYLKMK